MGQKVAVETLPAIKAQKSRGEEAEVEDGVEDVHADEIANDKEKATEEEGEKSMPRQHRRVAKIKILEDQAKSPGNLKTLESQQGQVVTCPGHGI